MCPADFFYRHTNEILFDRDEIVVLLTSLYKEIFFVDEVGSRYWAIEGIEFLFIEAHATPFDQFSHLTLAGEDVHSLLIEEIDSR